MREREPDEVMDWCECKNCGAHVEVASYLKRGNMVYCKECEEAYIISSRNPTTIQVQKERQLGTPWLDGSYFI
ncbi:hypothetical protein UWK_00593 [Desulfocapsa sulfexigens DSM 10523]|uniref:Uncharacterized protein n=1 Tax=Desulfocapsa sulfexigens (strain DSM 10523 / SB164P1) TaxID=1167006 RepID=M1NBJ2_DESSD|nr:hypothetical protein [Desulfocapsa sulfexigens]AGF77174.1 hypothetical protein UWK_00593 [Desulfocapsa sulfexigens DSM 10523]